MFARNHYYSQPQYVDFAALAEARAAEAAAKAAEAEYVAQQAEARARVRPQFWAPASPSRCSTQYSCTCSACAGPQQSTFGYSPYYEEDYAPVSYGFGGYSRPQYSKPHHHQPHYANPRHTQHTLSELELELELKKERLARLQLEQELRKLKAREQQLSQSHFGTSQRPSQKSTRCPSNPKSADDDTKLSALFGDRYPQQPGFVWPQPAAAAKRRAAPARPAPACRNSAIAEDFITNMILQGIEADRNNQDKAQKPKVTKKRLEEAPKQPKKVEQKGSLVDQLKARYEHEGEGGIRDTIQSVVNSLSTPPKQHPRQPSPSPPAVKQSAHTPPASNSHPGYDILEALLANILNQTPARSASSRPTQVTSPSTSAPAPATSSTTGKGKEKENVTPSTGTAESTSQDVVNALKKVEKIEHTFHSLQADFTFPAELDFAHSTSPATTAIFPHLAFTARNHPVRYYEQTLSSLLQELDLIESHGNANLRLRRKRIASAIETALEELEREVAGRRMARMAKEQKGDEATEAAAQACKSVRIPIVDGNTKDEPAPKEAEVTPIPEVTPAEEFAPSPEEDTTRTPEEAPVEVLEPETPKAEAAESVEEVTLEQSEPQTFRTEEEEIAEEPIPIELFPAEDVFLESPVSPTTADPETPSSLSEIPSTDTEPTREFETISDPETPSSLSANHSTEPSAAPAPELDSEVSSSTLQTLEEAAPAEKALETSDADSQLEALTIDLSESPSPGSPKTVEDGRDISDDDGFLLAQPDSPEPGQKDSRSLKRRSVEIEDLGSDWEDVDDA